jgi:tetraacyldisaccharide 4'-kinase
MSGQKANNYNHMKLLKIILYPLTPVYFLAIKVRNLFFDKNIFKSKRVTAKVISVGNITVGGSGKTPLVIYLAALLKNSGRKVGVLSRGYGRKSNGYKLVSDGKTIITTVRESGDEIYHTVLECKVPAAVSEDRVIGAERLIEETGIDTIVLDDAFQHRWIGRDLDLVVVEQRFLTSNNFFVNNLLPAGNLREPHSALQRADAIVINRKFSEQMEIPVDRKRYFEGKKIFTARYNAIEFVDIIKKEAYSLEEFNRQKSLVVSGIANPVSFLNILLQANVDTSNKIIFRDHKDYTLKEVQQIRKEFYATNSHSVVTTEKDAVKLMNFAKELDDIDIFYLKIKLEIDDEELFKKFLLEKIN